MNPILYFSEKIKEYDVSIVTVNMNKNENLLSSIHSWIDLPIKEIIIIDWCSDDIFETLIPTYLKFDKNFSKIKFYRVDGVDKYVPTWSYNLGFHMTMSKYILKLDTDTIINKDFFVLNNIETEPNIFFHNNNIFYCEKSHLKNIGYYNEFIDIHGFENNDLFSRLKNNGLIDKKLKCNILYNNNEIIKYNKFKSSSSYKIKLFNINRFILSKINSKSYTINDNCINYKDEEEKEQNEFKIIINDEKFVILKVFNGICNRLRSLISMICFCKTYKYKLYVIWEETKGFDKSDFYDLFTYANETDVIFISTKDIDISKIVFDYIILYNEIITEANKNFNLKYSKIYVETSDYIFNTLHINLPNHKQLYKNIGPSEKINNITKYINENIIKGIFYNIFHIRRGDSVCKNNKMSHNYKWSSIYMFAKYINDSYEKNIVLSDDYDYCNRFLQILCRREKIYDNYTIINKNNFNKDVLYDGCKKFIFQDVIDFFIFKNSIKIYGTNWSTYTEIASQIFDKEHIKVLDNNYYTLLKNRNKPENDELIHKYLPYINNYIDKKDVEYHSGILITTEILESYNSKIKYFMIDIENDSDEKIISSIYKKFYCTEIKN